MSRVSKAKQIYSQVRSPLSGMVKYTPPPSALIKYQPKPRSMVRYRPQQTAVRPWIHDYLRSVVSDMGKRSMGVGSVRYDDAPFDATTPNVFNTGKSMVVPGGPLVPAAVHRKVPKQQQISKLTHVMGQKGKERSPYTSFAKAPLGSTPATEKWGSEAIALHEGQPRITTDELLKEFAQTQEPLADTPALYSSGEMFDPKKEGPEYVSAAQQLHGTAQKAKWTTRERAATTSLAQQEELTEGSVPADKHTLYEQHDMPPIDPNVRKMLNLPDSVKNWKDAVIHASTTMGVPIHPVFLHPHGFRFPVSKGVDSEAAYKQRLAPKVLAKRVVSEQEKAKKKFTRRLHEKEPGDLAALVQHE